APGDRKRWQRPCSLSRLHCKSKPAVSDTSAPGAGNHLQNVEKQFSYLSRGAGVSFVPMSDPANPAPKSTVDPRVVRRKVALRLLPLVFILYVVAYLDRANAGFAKPRMQEALGFTDQEFGWGFGIFFIGYLLLEIPGALIVERRSATRWFTR